MLSWVGICPCKIDITSLLYESSTLVGSFALKLIVNQKNGWIGLNIIHFKNNNCRIPFLMTYLEHVDSIQGNLNNYIEVG